MVNDNKKKEELKKQGEEDKSSSSHVALARELEECQKKKDEYLSGWQRARADFINHKKEELERMESIIKFANEELVLKMLPVLDNFCLVEKEIPEDLKENDCIKGILQLKIQILDFLKQEGVEEIKAEGEKFDPNFMEAAEMVEAEDMDSGMVAEEIQKGYTLNCKVIRPAKVKVVK
ncbi:MAG: nucleotide exchange factor GrpE [bacterium]|nr:nucleotide exchange factor GrpE [bacterium]